MTAGVRSRARPPPAQEPILAAICLRQRLARECYSLLGRSRERRRLMLYWALVFLVIAVVAGLLGFGGIASAASGIAQVLFFVFLVVFVIALIMGLMARRGPPVV